MCVTLFISLLHVNELFIVCPLSICTSIHPSIHQSVYCPNMFPYFYFCLLFTVVLFCFVFLHFNVKIFYWLSKLLLIKRHIITMPPQSVRCWLVLWLKQEKYFPIQSNKNKKKFFLLRINKFVWPIKWKQKFKRDLMKRYKFY